MSHLFPSHPIRHALGLVALCLLSTGMPLIPHAARAQTSITGDKVECKNGTAGSYPCEDVDLLSFLSIADLGGSSGAQLNDVWGWTDPQTGTEYALVGRTDGTAFVDVSTPTQPVLIGELPSHSEPSTWRDVKVYQNHAFVVSEASEHGMQVFDLTQLRTVEAKERPVTFSETAHYNGVKEARLETAHNVAINVESGFAFIVGGGAPDTSDTCGGGLHMVNIHSPTTPTFAGCFPESSKGHTQSAPRGEPATQEFSDPRESLKGRSDAGYTHDTQCVVYEGPDTEYQGEEICFNANETVINIANVTDKNASTTIAETDYPKVGYVHQAWLTEDHRYLYVDDELDERNGLVDNTRTLVLDVTDLDNPTHVESYFGSTGAIDHNQYIDGNYSYQANYTSGLRVLDVAEPEAPDGVAYFDTFPSDNDPAFQGAWSTYPFFERNIVLISSIGAGLFVVQPLPSPILSLTATRRGPRATVSWEISATVQTARMEIEHKPPEAATWTTVGTVSGRSGDGAQEYEYTLDDLSPGTHQVRVRHVSMDGTTSVSNAVEVQVLPTAPYTATGPFPNPVRSQSLFKVILRKAQPLHVALYDAMGRRVRVLHDGQLEAGVIHRFRIHAHKRASGPYFLRVQGDSVEITRKVTVVR